MKHNPDNNDKKNSQLIEDPQHLLRRKDQCSQGIRMLVSHSAHNVGRQLLGAVIVLLVAGCATPMPRSDDPYEKFNRKMYAFNDYADHVAIRPVANAYRNVTPQTVEATFT